MTSSDAQKQTWYSFDHGQTDSSRGLLIALKMESGSTSETSVNFYQTTRRINPEDSRLHTRRENLKSHLFNFVHFRLEDIGALHLLDAR
jgi:hypothetical protein